MSINIDMCIKNAASNINESIGEHPIEEVKTRSLLSIANSLLAIAAMMHKSMFGYHLDVDTVEFAKKVKR